MSSREASSPEISMRIEEQVIADHAEIRDCYNQWDASWVAGKKEEAVKWYNQLVWSIARHSAAEEVILYPMYESKLGDWGKEHATLSRNEHQQVKEALEELEGLSMDNVLFPPKLRGMMEILNKHMDHEEAQELPRLVQIVFDKERIDAGKSFDRRKILAPTHPHPSAPNKPLFETLVGLLTLPFDKLEDLFREFPSKDEIEARKPLPEPVI